MERFRLRWLYEVMARAPCLLRSDDLWTHVGLWAAATGREVAAAAVAVAMARAVDKGMVEAWKDPELGGHFCMSPLLAEYLNLQPTDDPEPIWLVRQRPLRRRRVVRPSQFLPWADNDFALEHLAAREPREPLRAWDADYPPPVRHVLGMRVAWSGLSGLKVVGGQAGPCPGCGGARLSVFAYCALCDRSGFDAAFEAHWAAHKKPPRTRKKYDPGPLKGGVSA
jgi:hypothetical protein